MTPPCYFKLDIDPELKVSGTAGEVQPAAAMYAANGGRFTFP